jgi:serine/arginine repetitive matrix protein 2
MSVSSQGPPITLYNRSFGTHRRNDSSASSSSVAMSYSRQGANSGMAWTRHRREVSVESVMSDFSGMYLGRPGLGDKMFKNAADHGLLTSISASPLESAARPHVGDRSSFDSIIDDKQRSQEDRCLSKLIIIPPRHLILYSPMIILSKVVSFLPINSGLFLFTVSAAFIVQWKKIIQ